MILVRLLPVLLLAACAVPVQDSAPVDPQPFRITRSADEAVAAYIRVSRRIEPVAERLCRDKNPTAPATYCDFQILVERSTNQPPNAFQTIGKDGRPIIAFNVPMVATVENDHEIAFILGHEAGHQIRSHIVKANANANLGAALAGVLSSLGGGGPNSVARAQRLGGQIGARAYSQDHELQADEVGAYIAHLAGYDPLIGAQSFARFSGGNNPLSTHPPTGARLATVQRTVARINALRAAGQPVTLP